MQARIGWLLAVVGVVVSQGLASAADDTLDVKGAWQAITVEHGTDKQEGEKIEKITLTFDKDRVVSEGNEGEDAKLTLTYKIDQKEGLKKIDFEVIEGKLKGKKIPGIVRKDGDKLQLCVVISDGDDAAERPTDFAARVDRPWILITLKPKK